jgi:formylglycine-generating enzyme required for sulfatase activity
MQIAINIRLEMIRIPSGTFLIGSPEDELGRWVHEGPQQKVTVPSFSMGKYSVTQAQWRTVANLPQVKQELNPDPSGFKGDNRPVEQVNWHEAMEFCARLSAHAGQTYTLPSEAQWEYACRAGTTTPFHFGETITTDLANYDGDHTYGTGPKGIHRGVTTEVGSFLPNGFGLYDMHGNVWEWCLDYYRNTYEDARAVGSAWVTGKPSKHRILKGGSWYNFPESCRCADRHDAHEFSRDDIIGFRVVSVQH